MQLRRFYQLLCLCHGNGQGLLANHVLPGLERVFRDGKVEGVGRADVDSIHGRVFQDAAVIRVGFLDAELGGELVRLLDLRLADRVELNVTQAADSFQMDAAHEAGAEQCGLEFAHKCLSVPNV